MKSVTAKKRKRAPAVEGARRDWEEHSLSDIVRIEDRFYILATSSLADERTRVLKQGETFAVFDHFGDIKPVGLGEEGLYHEGTRFLSSLMLRLKRERPLFLSSTVQEDNALMVVDVTNPDIPLDGHIMVPRGTLHLHRTKFLWNGACYERFSIRNYGLQPVNLSFSLYFDADFSDIFEVRGMKRKKRGKRLPASVRKNRVTLGYGGLDGVERHTIINFNPAPQHLSGHRARFEAMLAPEQERAWEVIVECDAGGGRRTVPAYSKAADKATRARRRADARASQIVTSNEQFNDWINRSMADVRMMVTDTAQGPYPYAGVPWFSTAFGRDGIITAFECLWLNPAMAAGVLRFLAANQARRENPAQDAEPGKILHETRKGEMAGLGEIPFGRYYGSIDSTPLFIKLAGAYFERSDDIQLIRDLWPNIELALRWIDEYGDSDGDGLVEYQRRTPEGLVQQGWKDSHDSVFHDDGEMAEPPIALCEVQGYVFAAKQSAARLAEALGKTNLSEKLLREAEELRRRFEAKFWCDDLSMYALALDGKKRPCRVRGSNAGHCLWSGIAAPDRARRTAARLLHEESFSGWGIRTLAANQARYNPMSYHNGSIWPHDNALIAAGFARYGFRDQAATVLAAMFDTSLFVDMQRLPELFCGFPRRHGSSPTLYPVACAPQSWAAAAVFLLLQSCLGLSIDAPRNKLRFVEPLLPEFLQRVWIKDLRVAQSTFDLQFERHESDTTIKVLRRDGNARLVIMK